MNRSTLLLFFCVFALNEVILTAKMARIRGMVGRKNLSVKRSVINGVLLRSADEQCITDKQCEKMCHMEGGSGGIVSEDVRFYCLCDDDPKRRPTIENCAAACKILGVGAGELMNGECTCMPWEICGGSMWLKRTM